MDHHEFRASAHSSQVLNGHHCLAKSAFLAPELSLQQHLTDDNKQDVRSMTLPRWALCQPLTPPYLKLLLLRKALGALAGGVAHKGHDPHLRVVLAQHFCNFLHTVTEGGEDHDSGLPRLAFRCTLIYWMQEKESETPHIRKCIVPAPTSFFRWAALPRRSRPKLRRPLAASLLYYTP